MPGTWSGECVHVVPDLLLSKSETVVHILPFKKSRLCGLNKQVVSTRNDCPRITTLTATGHDRSRQRNHTIAPLSPQITVCDGKVHHPAHYPLEEDKQLLPSSFTSSVGHSSVKISSLGLISELSLSWNGFLFALPHQHWHLYTFLLKFHVIPSMQISKNTCKSWGTTRVLHSISQNKSKLVTFLVVSKEYFSSTYFAFNAYFVFQFKYSDPQSCTLVLQATSSQGILNWQMLRYFFCNFFYWIIWR